MLMNVLKGSVERFVVEPVLSVLKVDYNWWFLDRLEFYSLAKNKEYQMLIYSKSFIFFAVFFYFKRPIWI